MSLPLLAAGIVAVLALGYFVYGNFVARQLNLDAQAQTPAERFTDGVDFVPTRPFYLMGQHFSAIAAAGPIAGPILACQQFGWMPAVMWIAGGVVFIGAVHDLSTLVASVRHEGRSIAEVIKANLGPTAGMAMLGFIWVALLYVIVAFADVTAATFVSKDADLQGMTFRFNQGGAVAAASIFYLTLAILMGLVERYLKPPLWLVTVIFVPATLGAVWLGTQVSTWFLFSDRTWAVTILAYCFLASLVPVWALLQPRGYLGGFILYLALFVGVVGMFFGDFTVGQAAFKGWEAPGATGSLFPFLFVTIACGACSGFHGLVCSGTTSKQISRETHCKPVGYGAMLLEGFVAVIALGTIMVLTPKEATGLGPGAIYGAGLGRFLTVIIGEEHLLFATTFGAMAFSTFVFDTLDVSTRLSRYILQELFSLKGRAGAILATLVTVTIPLVFVLLAGKNAWQAYWTLFGTSNQLLAALSLIGITVWLKKIGRRHWYTLWPAVFVSIITVTSLVMQIRSAFFAPAPTRALIINGWVALILLALASSLMFYGARAIFGGRRPVTGATAT